MERKQIELKHNPANNEQLITAATVADWFVPYIYGVDIEPGDIPLIVQARFNDFMGTRDAAEQLPIARQLINELPSQHKNNGVLYCAGYPQDALSVLADGDINVTIELLMSAGEQYRQELIAQLAHNNMPEAASPSDSELSRSDHVPHKIDRRRIDLRKGLIESGVTDDQMLDRLNGNIAQASLKNRSKVVRSSARFLDWYRGELSIEELAASQNISVGSLRTSIKQLALIALDKAFEAEHGIGDIVGESMQHPFVSANPRSRVESLARESISLVQQLGPYSNDELDPAYQGLSWQTDALCTQTDPEAFFPEKGGSTKDAKKICLSCDVRNECLEYAIANDERFGVWGGLSERQRRKLAASKK
jgi:WhiB family redox-sensing transcriptional regulator